MPERPPFSLHPWAQRNLERHLEKIPENERKRALRHASDLYEMHAIQQCLATWSMRVRSSEYWAKAYHTGNLQGWLIEHYINHAVLLHHFDHAIERQHRLVRDLVVLVFLGYLLTLAYFLVNTMWSGFAVLVSLFAPEQLPQALTQLAFHFSLFTGMFMVVLFQFRTLKISGRKSIFIRRMDQLLERIKLPMKNNPPPHPFFDRLAEGVLWMADFVSQEAVAYLTAQEHHLVVARIQSRCKPD